MTTPARQAEAEKVYLVYHAALVQVGIGTIEEAIDLWGDVNPAKVAPTATRWLTRAVALILSRRRMARDLGFTYYRLARALRTGATIADPYRPDDKPTMTTLRREFASMVEDITSVTAPPNSDQGKRTAERLEATPEVEAPPVPSLTTEDDDELDRLLVEELDGLRALEDELERAAEEEARIALEALGTESLMRRLEAQREADAEEAHRKSGARQAAAAERIVMNGARGTTWAMGERDKRCIGWARFSKTGTPCGFCAMLISRGFTPKSGLYGSKASALYSDGELYHDNCHCDAEQIFAESQFDSPRFALNREYALLWPKVTKGYGGKDALALWRKYIDTQRDAPVARAA